MQSEFSVKKKIHTCILFQLNFVKSDLNNRKEALLKCGYGITCVLYLSSTRNPCVYLKKSLLCMTDIKKQ